MQAQVCVQRKQVLEACQMRTCTDTVNGAPSLWLPVISLTGPTIHALLLWLFMAPLGPLRTRSTSLRRSGSCSRRPSFMPFMARDVRPNSCAATGSALDTRRLELISRVPAGGRRAGRRMVRSASLEQAWNNNVMVRLHAGQDGSAVYTQYTHWPSCNHSSTRDPAWQRPAQLPHLP